MKDVIFMASLKIGDTELVCDVIKASMRGCNNNNKGL